MKYPEPAPAVLVTGANRGLGLALCKALALQGTPVVALGRDANATRKALMQENIRFTQCWGWDFSRPCRSLEFFKLLPPLKGVIHCASPNMRKTIGQLGAEEFALLGNFSGNNLALARMSLEKVAKAGGGNILFIGSIASKLKGEHVKQTAFGVYKHSLAPLARAINLEGENACVHASCVHLGSFADDETHEVVAGKVLAQSRVVEFLLSLMQCPLKEDSIVFSTEIEYLPFSHLNQKENLWPTLFRP